MGTDKEIPHEKRGWIMRNKKSWHNKIWKTVFICIFAFFMMPFASAEETVRIDSRTHTDWPTSCLEAGDVTYTYETLSELLEKNLLAEQIIADCDSLIFIAPDFTAYDGNFAHADISEIAQKAGEYPVTLYLWNENFETDYLTIYVSVSDPVPPPAPEPDPEPEKPSDNPTPETEQTPPSPKPTFPVSPPSAPNPAPENTQTKPSTNTAGSNQPITNSNINKNSNTPGSPVIPQITEESPSNEPAIISPEPQEDKPAWRFLLEHSYVLTFGASIIYVVVLLISLLPSIFVLHWLYKKQQQRLQKLRQSQKRKGR